MKNRMLFAVVLLLSSLSFSACENVADDGTPDDPRDQIVGTWNQYIGETPFQVSITKDQASTTGLIFNGFDDISDDVKATLSGLNISIPQQTIAGEVLVGSGVIESDYSRITFSYTNDGVAFSSEMRRYNPNAKQQPQADGL